MAGSWLSASVFAAFLGMPLPLDAEVPLRIAAIGDYGAAGDGELAVSNLVRALDPSIIITLGDNSYIDVDIDDNVGQYYSDYIGSYIGAYGAGSLNGNRFFPSLGNHDYSDGGGIDAYLEYFELPGANVESTHTSGNERYYDFVYGPIHFFVVNSCAGEPDGTDSESVQAQWLQQQLAASTQPWKLVYFHHAAYSSGKQHGNNEYMQWPFKEWGASAVLAGHDHIYERLIVDGLPYFVNGLGGRSTREIVSSPEPGSVVRYSDDLGTMLLTATDTSLRFEFFSVDPADSLVDSYTLTQTAPDVAPSPAAIAYTTYVTTVDVQRLELRNVGTSRLDIANVFVDGADAGDFRIVRPLDPQQGPRGDSEVAGGAIRLQPGDSWSADVRFAPTQVGPKQAVIRVASNDPNEGALQVPLIAEAVPLPAPEIVVSADTLDFGDIQIPSSKRHTVWMWNDGDKELQVHSISLGGLDMQDFSLLEGGGSYLLVPGDSIQVVVECAPTSGGSKSAHLNIKSDDEDEGAIAVACLANAIPPTPDIDVSTTALDYGGLVVAGAATQVVQIHSVGTGDLEVASIAVQGADATQFAVTSGPEAASLSPGDSVEIHVAFSPTTVGVKVATLRITSDDPDEPTWDVALSGVGVDPAGTPGEVVFEEAVVGASTGSSSVGTANSLTAVDGHLYLAAVASKSHRSLDEVTGMDLEWTPVLEQCAAREQTGVHVWMARGTPTPGNVTAVFDGSADSAVLVVSRYSGADPEAPLGNWVSANTNGVAGSCTGGVDSDSYDLELATTVPDALVFGAVAMRTRTLDPGSGYALRAESRAGSGGKGSGIATLDQEFAQPGNVAFDGSFSREVDWAVAALEIRSSLYFTEITVSPESHDFGAVGVGQSATASIEIRNEGEADLQLPSISLHGPNAEEFAIAGGGEPTTLAPGAMHLVTLTAAPQSVGPKSAWLRVVSNDADEVTTDVALAASGFALEPHVGIEPLDLAFGDVMVGSSASMACWLRNDGKADLQVSAAAITGNHPLDFALSGGAAPFTVPPGDSAEVEVSFAPTASGPRDAALLLTTNDPDLTSVSVTLSGTGLPAPAPDIAVLPTSYDFGDVMVLATAECEFLVHNEGSLTLDVTSLAVVGPDSLEFALTNGAVPFTLVAGDSAAVGITFAPTTVGAKSATLRCASDDPDEATLDVALSGKANPPPAPQIAVQPTTLAFGDVTTFSSMTFDVRVYNVGSDSLDVVGTAVSGPDSLDFAITDGGAPFTLAVDDSAVIKVTLTPSSDGTKSATLQIHSNDPEQGVLYIPLSGAGIVPVPGMVVFEESVGGDASGSSRVETDASLAAVDGHLYLAAIATRGYQPVAAVTGMGLTWTLVRAQCAGREQTGVEVWVGSGTPSAGVVTATMQAEPSKAVIVVSRYSGTHLSAAIGNVVSANTNGNDGDCAGGEDNDSFDIGMQTSTANAMVYAAVAMRHRTLTPGNGYTLRHEERRGSQGMVASVAVLDREFESPATVRIDGSFSGDVDWAVIGIEIRPAPLTTKQAPQDAEPVGWPGLTLRNGIGGSDPWIELAAPRTAPAAVRIFDVRGRLVDVPWMGPAPAGRVRLDWNGLDRSGRRLPAGVYLVRAEIDGRVLTGKLIILR